MCLLGEVKGIYSRKYFDFVQGKISIFKVRIQNINNACIFDSLCRIDLMVIRSKSSGQLNHFSDQRVDGPFVEDEKDFLSLQLLDVLIT